MHLGPPVCIKWESSHLQSEPEKGGSGGGAVDGPVAPGGGQSHRVVAVHVGEEEQPCSRTLAYIPEVYGQWGSRDDLPIGWHDALFWLDGPQPLLRLNNRFCGTHGGGKSLDKVINWINAVVGITQMYLLRVSLRRQILLPYYALSTVATNIILRVRQNRHFYLQFYWLLLWTVKCNSVGTLSPPTALLCKRLYIHFNEISVVLNLRIYKKIHGFFLRKRLTTCHFASSS